MTRGEVQRTVPAGGKTHSEIQRPQLGLGTVQWGMPYGIANRSGQPGSAEVGAMLRLARAQGVQLLDTAHAYGAAETLLGKLNAAAQGFRVVTKTQPLPGGAVGQENIRKIVQAFDGSLARLASDRVYALLAHHADALLAEGGRQVWAALEAIKAEGRTQKIGVSVYHPEQLEAILERYRIDLVQLPVNIYDQRFAQSGLLQRLTRLGVEVHARSAFLQGVLLSPPSELPPYFDPIRTHHARLHRLFADHGMTPLAGCLRHCLRQPDIDAVVVGCESLGQLNEILDVKCDDRTDMPPVASYALAEERFINPSQWTFAPA